VVEAVSLVVIYTTVSLMTIGKPVAATAVYKLLMMGMRMHETC